MFPDTTLKITSTLDSYRNTGIHSPSPGPKKQLDPLSKMEIMIKKMSDFLSVRTTPPPHMPMHRSRGGGEFRPNLESLTNTLRFWFP